MIHVFEQVQQGHCEVLGVAEKEKLGRVMREEEEAVTHTHTHTHTHIFIHTYTHARHIPNKKGQCFEVTD